MRIVIRKTDLDTALSALLLGFTDGDEILERPSGATADELADPSVFCIECGGSGDVAHSNFDHHDPDLSLPSACVQAWHTVLASGHPFDAQAQRLVDYVSILDTQGPHGLPPRTTAPVFPHKTLSAVFSGMRPLNPNAGDQLRKGIAILRTVLEQEIDPFGPMPALPEWMSYVEAKKSLALALSKAVERARFFSTRTGRRAGTLPTIAPGALGALYAKGCDVAIAQSPGPVAGTWKYTIGADQGLEISHLLPLLDRIEPGWGGPSSGTIIGSPHTGSRLTLDRLSAIIEETL